MTNQRARDSDIPKPVFNHQNNAVNRLALTADFLFEETLTDARELREQHAVYLKSLPTDPDEAIRAALRLFGCDSNGYPEGVEEALHLSSVLSDLMCVACDKDIEWEPNGAKYVAERIEAAMHKAVLVLDRVNDILRNPTKSERKVV